MLKALISLLIAHVALLAIYGNEMNTNHVLGAFFAWTGLISWSLLAFWVGAKPYSKHPNFKRSYFCAIISLVTGIFLIPLMSLVNGKFPPTKLSDIEAAIGLTVILIAVIGPLSPRMCNYKKHISSANMEQRQMISQRMGTKSRRKTNSEDRRRQT